MALAEDGIAPAEAAAPGTGRAAAKAERRRQLIEATIRCIARHGLSGTTIARVSQFAGTSVGLANFHFETKERLLEAVLRHLAEEQRALWTARLADPGLPPAARLRAIVEARFDPRICTRRKLAIWFAFWGDAAARAIYRRAVGDLDEERLAAATAALAALQGGSRPDPRTTLLGLEAFLDGLWLNMLLYPADFRRRTCRALALAQLSARVPAAAPAG